MMDYQNADPMCARSIIRDDDLDEAFSFSFSLQSIVLKELEEEREEDQDSEFEFNCITPDSPSSDPEQHFPADFLFFNGRLQPHSFPFQFNDNKIDYSRSTSRTSSINSSSFTTSRSNSSNSGSSCSSARTSSSEYRDKKPMLYSNNDDTNTTMARLHSSTMKPDKVQPYGSRQRWQFMKPAPVLMIPAELPRRKTSEAAVHVRQQSRSNKKVEKKCERSWFIIRLLRSILTLCRECHGLEPSVEQ
ncbi:hypothetical protein FRX31_023177 [Thalictrum thalictroides]|uniref:Membrane-associated kinase regulator n=1 Tax=Thalictrum thalictroides TaxID=46969 RepID=A0A7J6VR46_THATH|nr:hypothetical protein FRX31_023177 [Thalictrum thalictroides]